MTNQSSNKRIAKNTIMLYIRMFIATVVGFYTTRVVLQTLGVEDYGIYGVVGSIMSMLSFLKSSMSNSTSRFFSYDLGKGNIKKLKETFSSAMIIHIFFAVIIVFLGETIGFWFLENKLVIPVERMDAAKWVLHLSVISSAVTITQVPYNSIIIAHERMGIYAYIEVLNVSLKLVIVYLLTIGDFDKLKLYAVLVLSVTIIISFIYRLYCIKNFEETHFIWHWRVDSIRRIMGFSIWQMFSSLCISFKQQGQDFIVNIYKGVSLNAALGISGMLYGTLTGLSYNMLSAFNPPIIKAYAMGEYGKMTTLMSNATKMSFLLLSFISVPFIVNVRLILDFWLGEVPEYVCEICIVALIFNCIGVVNSVFQTSIDATGKKRNVAIIIGLSMLIGLFALWITFYIELPIIYSFCAFYVGTPIMIVGCVIEAKRKLPFLPVKFLCIEGILKPGIIAFFVYAIVYMIHSLFDYGFLQFFVTSIVSCIVFLFLIYLIGFDAAQKKIVQNKIGRLMN